MGDLTGNEDLTKEGRADEKAGEVKEFTEGTKDKPDDPLDTVKDKITKHRPGDRAPDACRSAALNITAP